MNRKQLLKLKPTSERVGLSVATLTNLRRQNKIPFVRAGYRTVLFDPDKVIEALEKFEVKAVA